MGCVSERTSERRVTSFPMKDLGGSGRSSAYTDRNGDAPVRQNIISFHPLFFKKSFCLYNNIVHWLAKVPLGHLYCDCFGTGCGPDCDHCFGTD